LKKRQKLSARTYRYLNHHLSDLLQNRAILSICHIAARKDKIVFIGGVDRVLTAFINALTDLASLTAAHKFLMDAMQQKQVYEQYTNNWMNVQVLICLYNSYCKCVIKQPAVANLVINLL